MVTYLQGEGVIRGVEDGLRLLLHPVLHDHLSHLRYAFHLGVHRADDGLFPLVQLVTHQSEAKWRTQTSVNGFSRGRRRAGVSKAGAEGRPHSDPSFAVRLWARDSPSSSLAVRQAAWSHLPRGVVVRMNFGPRVNSSALRLAHSAH